VKRTIQRQLEKIRGLVGEKRFDGGNFDRACETEVTTPAPHIRGQLLHRLLYADAFRPSRDLADSPLKPIQGLWRNHALDLRTSGKAESQKLSLLRSRHRTLRFIYLEVELLRDKSRNALHHPLPRPLAANVDITVIRVANERMTTALQLPVEFVEYEVAERLANVDAELEQFAVDTRRSR
jgi:hypothetical protein